MGGKNGGKGKGNGKGAGGKGKGGGAALTQPSQQAKRARSSLPQGATQEAELRPRAEDWSVRPCSVDQMKSLSLADGNGIALATPDPPSPQGEPQLARRGAAWRGSGAGVAREWRGSEVYFVPGVAREWRGSGAGVAREWRGVARV